MVVKPALTTLILILEHVLCWHQSVVACGLLLSITTATKNSPNPKGCPPIRTIFQSSPEALVKSTLFGNLEEEKKTNRTIILASVFIKIQLYHIKAG